MNVIAVGPSSTKISTGQSVHFNAVCSRIDNIVVVHYNKYASVLIDSVILLFKLFTTRISTDYNKIYYTPSRTPYGSLRDVMIIAILNIGKKDVNVFAHVHGSEFFDFFNSLNYICRGLVRWTYGQHSETFVLSDTIGKEISSLLGSSTKTIYNTIDLEAKDYIDVNNKSNHIITILWCSNLMYSKGFTYFADSVLALPDAYKKMFQIVIIGHLLGDNYKSEGEMKEIFNSYLAKFDEKSIKYSWKGAVPNHKIKEYFDVSNVFVLPTFYTSEAMPISVLEAVRSGVEVILSDWKSLKDIYGEYRMEFIEPKNILDLTHSLIRLINKCSNSNQIEDLEFNLRLLIKNNQVYNELLLNYLRDK